MQFMVGYNFIACNSKSVTLFENNIKIVAITIEHFTKNLINHLYSLKKFKSRILFQVVT